jgi:hypothetical protein
MTNHARGNGKSLESWIWIVEELYGKGGLEEQAQEFDAALKAILRRIGV